MAVEMSVEEAKARLRESAENGAQPHIPFATVSRAMLAALLAGTALGLCPSLARALARCGRFTFDLCFGSGRTHRPCR